jgi:hypothetical protein
MDTYRILVTGSRKWRWQDVQIIRDALGEEFIKAMRLGRSPVVVHGGATGADTYASAWAYQLGHRTELHLAEWRKNGIYNPQAGLIRNRKMVEAGADVTLAFIRNGSRGATHCADLAEAAGIPVRRYLTSGPDDVKPPVKRIGI